MCLFCSLSQSNFLLSIKLVLQPIVFMISLNETQVHDISLLSFMFYLLTQFSLCVDSVVIICHPFCLLKTSELSFIVDNGWPRYQTKRCIVLHLDWNQYLVFNLEYTSTKCINCYNCSLYMQFLLLLWIIRKLIKNFYNKSLSTYFPDLSSSKKSRCA